MVRLAMLYVKGISFQCEARGKSGCFSSKLCKVFLVKFHLSSSDFSLAKFKEMFPTVSTSETNFP